MTFSFVGGLFAEIVIYLVAFAKTIKVGITFFFIVEEVIIPGNPDLPEAKGE